MTARRRSPAARHGTAGMYTNHGCRCAECRRAWAESIREANARLHARNLARGLTTNGDERSTPYDRRALALLERFGLEPHPDWLPARGR